MIRLHPSPLLMVLVLSALSLLVIGYAWFLQIPKLKEIRTAINQHQHSILMAENRQASLQSTKQDLAALQTETNQLRQEIWPFAQEDDFFDIWPAWARTYQLTMPTPQVDEVTPTGTLIMRSATVTATGTLAHLGQLLSALQKHQPLLAVTQVTLSPATGVDLTAVITLSTLWQ